MNAAQPGSDASPRFIVEDATSSTFHCFFSSQHIPNDTPPAEPSCDEDESETTIKIHEDAGDAVHYVPTEAEITENTVNTSTTAPFRSEKVYNLARWLITNDIPVEAVNELLSPKSNMPLLPEVYNEITSNYTLRNKVKQMNDGIGDNWIHENSELHWNNDQKYGKISWWRRDLVSSIKWLLRQPYLNGHLTYAPCIIEENGERVYHELHSGRWWEEMQVIELPKPVISRY